MFCSIPRLGSPRGCWHILAIAEEGAGTPSLPNLEPQEIQCPHLILGHPTPIWLEESNQFPERERERGRESERERDAIEAEKQFSSPKISLPLECPQETPGLKWSEASFFSLPHSSLVGRWQLSICPKY
ncbi:hypothetical protein HJG60_009820 [Phyllostomus discolor]|uniref:Uncharacterized protein n=1 Tax=Phyllostomus discolor TaxID=89673 RepID=A0A834B8A1_9CHIR|nr:hypothetical protein HJG60_009820 [Phyllostomus discolor]